MKKIPIVLLATVFLSGCTAADFAKRAANLEKVSLDAVEFSVQRNQLERFHFDAAAEGLRKEVLAAYALEMERCGGETTLECKENVFKKANKWIKENKPSLYIEKVIAKWEEIKDQVRD